MLKKIIGWVLLAFLVFYVVTQPTQAASIFRSLGSGLGSVGTGLASFVSSLT